MSFFYTYFLVYSAFQNVVNDSTHSLITKIRYNSTYIPDDLAAVQQICEKVGIQNDSKSHSDAG